MNFGRKFRLFTKDAVTAERIEFKVVHPDLSNHPHFAGVTHISELSQAHSHGASNLPHFLLNTSEWRLSICSVAFPDSPHKSIIVINICLCVCKL